MVKLSFHKSLFLDKKLRTTLLHYGLLGGKVIQNGNNS